MDLGLLQSDPIFQFLSAVWPVWVGFPNRSPVENAWPAIAPTASPMSVGISTASIHPLMDGLYMFIPSHKWYINGDYGDGMGMVYYCFTNMTILTFCYKSIWVKVYWWSVYLVYLHYWLIWLLTWWFTKYHVGSTGAWQVAFPDASTTASPTSRSPGLGQWQHCSRRWWRGKVT